MAPSYRLPIVQERTVREAEAGRARLLQDFEKELQQEVLDAKAPVTCSKGCSDCCLHPVLMTVLEGVTMYRALREQGTWTQALRRQLQAHHSRVVGLDYTIWMLSLTPCPFLKDSLCSVYEHRPFQCRATYSVGDSYYCHPHRFGDSTGMVTRSALLTDLDKIEGPALKRHRQALVRLPLSTALLLGERLVQGDVELEDINTQIWQQWAEALGHD